MKDLLLLYCFSTPLHLILSQDVSEMDIMFTLLCRAPFNSYWRLFLHHFSCVPRQRLHHTGEEAVLIPLHRWGNRGQNTWIPCLRPHTTQPVSVLHSSVCHASCSPYRRPGRRHFLSLCILHRNPSLNQNSSCFIFAKHFNTGCVNC